MTARGKPDNVPTEWSPKTAEIVQGMFERLFDDNSTGVPDVANRLWRWNGTTALWEQADLATDVTGNLATTHLNGGSGASATTFWRGDGSWAAPPLGLMDLAAHHEFGYVDHYTIVGGYAIDNGTVFAGGSTRTFVLDTLMPHGKYATGGVSGNGAGWDSVSTCAPIFSMQNTFDLVSYISTPATITSVRYWLGLIDAAVGGTVSSFTDSDDPASRSYVAFRYSTAASDAGWVGCTRDGATQSVTAKIADIAGSTAYKMRMRYDGANVYFSVNGAAEVSTAANLPAAAQGLRYSFRVFTQTGSSREFNHSRTWCKYGT